MLTFNTLFLRALRDLGRYYCPICTAIVKQFLPNGNPTREKARCPKCRSLERHRLDWLFFRKFTNLFDSSAKSMLHIAPEIFLSQRFKKIKNLDYLSADLKSKIAMEKMDITKINYPDNTFSIIYCSHVLEHIPDDKKALSELYRVLKKGGWAVLQVPIMSEKTYEDPSIIDPEMRKKHFGQWDHVRCCGPDYIERIASVGFKAKTIRSTDIARESDCCTMGFQKSRRIFYCEKE